MWTRITSTDAPAAFQRFLSRDRHARSPHDRGNHPVAAEKKIAKDDFEFQMLYGVRTDLQRQLVRDGYHLRIYVPYGTEWFPYFMRRLAERPANLGFFLRIFFRS